MHSHYDDDNNPGFDPRFDDDGRDGHFENDAIAAHTRTHFRIPARVDLYPTWGDTTGTYGDDYEQRVKDAFVKIASREGYDVNDPSDPDMLIIDEAREDHEIEADFREMIREAHEIASDA